MTDTPKILLAHHLKSLKLPTFLREHDKLARQCASEGQDHVQFLTRLVELELIDRERRMIERPFSGHCCAMPCRATGSRRPSSPPSKASTVLTSRPFPP